MKGYIHVLCLSRFPFHANFCCPFTFCLSSSPRDFSFNSILRAVGISSQSKMSGTRKFESLKGPGTQWARYVSCYCVWSSCCLPSLPPSLIFFFWSFFKNWFSGIPPSLWIIFALPESLFRITFVLFPLISLEIFLFFSLLLVLSFLGLFSATAENDLPSLPILCICFIKGVYFGILFFTFVGVWIRGVDFMSVIVCH